MKLINGVWLPDYEEHLISHVQFGRAHKGRGTYQLRKFERAMDEVKSFRHAVDIGAHVGLWSWVMADKFETVTCFEPSPIQAECFRANMSECKNVTFHQVAIGREAGTLEMISPNDNSGNTRAVKPSGEERVDFVAECRTLDSYELQDVDFMKIDVEGFELNVIVGAIETIKRCKPVIVVEQKPKNAERHGFAQFSAIDTLARIGMKEAAVISGDHILIW